MILKTCIKSYKNIEINISYLKNQEYNSKGYKFVQIILAKFRVIN